MVSYGAMGLLEAVIDLTKSVVFSFQPSWTIVFEVAMWDADSFFG